MIGSKYLHKSFSDPTLPLDFNFPRQHLWMLPSSIWYFLEASKTEENISLVLRQITDLLFFNILPPLRTLVRNSYSSGWLSYSDNSQPHGNGSPNAPTSGSFQKGHGWIPTLISPLQLRSHMFRYSTANLSNKSSKVIPLPCTLPVHNNHLELHNLYSHIQNTHHQNRICI